MSGLPTITPQPCLRSLAHEKINSPILAIASLVFSSSTMRIPVESSIGVTHTLDYFRDGADDEVGGAVMLEVEGNRLDLKWICSDGKIGNHFTMMKEVSKSDDKMLPK